MPSSSTSTPDDALAQPAVLEAIRRRIIEIDDRRVRYLLAREHEYDWTDPEEWVRAATVAWLIVEKGYPANRIRLEVSVPRRTPSDYADIVVYEDDSCRTPYLVVENKASGQTPRARDQGIEQAFGNANSLRAPLTLYDEGESSVFFDVANHPPTERDENRLARIFHEGGTFRCSDAMAHFAPPFWDGGRVKTPWEGASQRLRRWSESVVGSALGQRA